MKEKIIEHEKGITLIALVITIIVLLILAGVAISMLSGENGILNQAAEAKKKTESESFAEQVKIAVMGAMTNEDAEIKESELITELNKLGIKEDDIINYGNGEYIVTNGTEKVTISKNGDAKNDSKIKDIDIKLQEHFNKKGLNYKCRYGYVTGFELNIGEFHTAENVKEFEEKLPEGYKVNLSYSYDEDSGRFNEITLNEDEKEERYIATGMSIQDENGKTVAMTVVYGDVICNGEIDDLDITAIDYYISFLDKIAEEDGFITEKWEEIQLLSADIDGDGEINEFDKLIISKYYGKISTYTDIIKNAQKNAVKLPAGKRMYKELQEYIAKLDKKTGYSFEYNEETDSYKLKGVKEGTTVEELIKALPNSEELSILEDATNFNNVISNDQVKNGYYLKREWKNKYNQTQYAIFAVIEVEQN